MLVPLDIVLFDDETGEDVHVVGELQVNTIIKFKKTPVQIKTSYKLTDNVVAIGETSNQGYKIDGRDTVKYRVRGTDISRIDHVAVFMLHPPDARSSADRAHAVEVQYQLYYGRGGVAPTANVLPPPQPGSCTAVAQFCN